MRIFCMAIATLCILSCSKSSDPVAPAGNARVRIVSLIPNPDGEDDYNESFTIRNLGTVAADLQGWKITDDDNVSWPLDSIGTLDAGASVKLISQKSAQLLNTGDTVYLIDASLNILQSIGFGDVKDGQVITLHHE